MGKELSDKDIKKRNDELKALRKQVKELEAEKDRFRNLYTKEYNTNMRLHQVEHDLTEELERLKNRISAQDCAMIERQQDIIMALITQRDPRLDREKLNIKRYNPRNLL